MAAAHLRRSVATAAVAAVTTVVAPLAVSLLAPTPASAASAPVMDETKSAPEQGGALWGTGEDITAVFDQAITGNQGTTSSTTCSDPTTCAFVLYEINADGSRGLRLPGTTTLTKSGNPVTGTTDTVDFNPEFNLANGGTYEALVHVASASDKTAVTNLDYKLYVSAVAPSKLSAPTAATTGNNTAFPLSGYAPPGMTVNVTVPDPDHPSQLTNVTGSTVVDPCSAISCPWTVKVDIHGFSSPHTGEDWTASVQDAGGQPSSNDSTNTADAKTQNPTATFNIDYSPPAMPNSFTATIANDSNAHTSVVTVSATDTDATTASYVVTVTDASKNQVQQTYPAQGTNLPSTQLDVSALDDGTVHVVIQAADSVGNVSPECDQNPPPVQKCTSKDLTKAAGLVPSLTTSTISAGGSDTTFANAQSQAVQTPTKITVGFTQTIKESWSNCCTQSGPVTHHSSLCIATPNGNCIASGGTPTVASDNRSITFPISTKLADGKYLVSVTTYSQGNCPDITPQNFNPQQPNGNCEQYSDYVRIPGTGNPATPFQFTVNSTPPTVTITSVTNPVNASNDKSVTASGTVAKSASTVQVLYTSGGKTPTKFLVNAVITQPSDPTAATATWSAGPSDLSSLPDGPVTVKVTAKTQSGLQATATKTITMQAHVSTLSEFTDHTVVTANRAIHISGHLSDQSGNPVADATISVRPRFTNGKLGHAATVVTNSSGAYSATFVPQFSARYIATYAGSPQNDAATANTARTNVRAAVSLGGKAKQSSPVAVTGHVSPNKSGKTVTIYKKTSRGWVVAGKAKLNSKSAFTAHLSLARGKNRLYAAIGATSGNLAGKSGVFVITVG